jgi:hypothetical protein
MAFKQITFERTIPPTVPSQDAPYTSTANATTISSPTSVSVLGASSIAAQLASQLTDLIDAATYIQNVIFSLNPGLGVTIDPTTEPDTARALSVVYNGSIPPAISLSMYGNVLDAELGATQVNQIAGPNSPVQANPIQYQALLSINKSVETQLANSGNFSAQSALLLRKLKSDVISNTNMQVGLMNYPAANTTQAPVSSKNVVSAATVDISPAVADIVQSHIDKSTNNYASMFNVLSQPDAIASDSGNVVSALASMSVPNLIQMNSLLQLTSSGPLTQGIASNSVGLSSFVYPQLISQSANVTFQLDQVTQISSTPVKQMSNSVSKFVNGLAQASGTIGSLVGVVRSMLKPPTTSTSGPLLGMPLNNASQSGLPGSSLIPNSISSLGYSSGINELSSLLKFSLSSTDAMMSVHIDSFQRLTSRSNSDTQTLVQSLSVSASMTSLMSLTSAFIKAQQNGSSLASQSSSNQLSTIGNIISNAQTGNGTTYTVQNGTVSINPPVIPAPTDGAVTVLQNAGIQTSLDGLTNLSDTSNA